MQEGEGEGREWVRARARGAENLGVIVIRGVVKGLAAEGALVDSRHAAEVEQTSAVTHAQTTQSERISAPECRVV